MDALIYNDARYGWANVMPAPETLSHIGTETSDPAWSGPFAGGYLSPEGEVLDADGRNSLSGPPGLTRFGC